MWLCRMNLVPYRETLPEDAKADLSEAVMVDTYLKPFFATGKHFVQLGWLGHTYHYVPAISTCIL